MCCSIEYTLFHMLTRYPLFYATKLLYRACGMMYTREYTLLYSSLSQTPRHAVNHVHGHVITVCLFCATTTFKWLPSPIRS